jgi:hypothetical protein
MKKLQKLSLKELENELTIIGCCELKLINGGGIYEDYFRGLGSAVENAVKNLTNSVYQTANDAHNAIVDFWNDHGDKIIGTTLSGVSVTIDVLMLFFTKSPYMGPYILDPSESDYQINPSCSSSGSFNNTYYKLGFG